jgi:hypothetical protein
VASSTEDLPTIETVGGNASPSVRRVATVLARQGNFEAALATAHLIDSVEAGHVEEAMDAVLSFEHDHWREIWLTKLAMTLARCGFGSESVRTSGAITVDRRERLPQIAGVLAARGDVESFRDLLEPCAYFPDAACRMCGHLARLFPDRGTEIAEIIVRGPEDPWETHAAPEG